MSDLEIRDAVAEDFANADRVSGREVNSRSVQRIAEAALTELDNRSGSASRPTVDTPKGIDDELEKAGARRMTSAELKSKKSDRDEPVFRNRADYERAARLKKRINLLRQYPEFRSAMMMAVKERKVGGTEQEYEKRVAMIMAEGDRLFGDWDREESRVLTFS